MKTYVILLISQLFLMSSCAKEATTSSKLSNKIEKKVSQIAEDHNIPSVELTIETATEIIKYSYHHPEVAPQNIYGLGSTSKFLAAVLIFKLIEDQQLSLEDTITNYVNLIQPIAGVENLRIKDLLNHTSGLSDYTQHPTWMTTIQNGTAPVTFEEKILLVDDSTNNSGNFSYSNTNYIFLQEIVETITGLSYDIAFNNFYRDHNFSGIQINIDENGLESYFGQTAQSSSNVAEVKEHYGYDGGAFANTETLNEFLNALYRNKRILSTYTLSQMEEWVPMNNFTIPFASGEISEYGYGILKLNYKEQDYIGHFGSTLRYQSLVLYNPVKDITISIATNCSGTYYNNVFFQLLAPSILDEL